MLGGAALLAEPVLGAATPTGYKSAAWYAAVEGESLPLSEVPAQERAEAIAHLGRSLDAIVDLVSEVPFGAWLRAAFIVPTADSIRVIDGKAVLVNWGFVPANLPQTGAALEKHFVDTIGTLVGWSGLPRINEAGEVEVPRLGPPVRPAHEPPPVPAAPTAASETAPSVPPPPPSAAVPPPAGPCSAAIPHLHRWVRCPCHLGHRNGWHRCGHRDADLGLLLQPLLHAPAIRARLRIRRQRGKGLGGEASVGRRRRLIAVRTVTGDGGLMTGAGLLLPKSSPVNVAGRGSQSVIVAKRP